MWYHIRVYIAKKKYKKYFKFLALAKLQADNLSKANNTKVGALILDESRTVISQGYNGAPRNCSADMIGDHRSTGDEKLHWVSHAELNAISNAARVGVALNNTTMIVTHYPCMECAKAIVQAGITTIICFKPEGGFLTKWKDSLDRSKLLFKECDVVVITL